MFENCHLPSCLHSLLKSSTSFRINCNFVFVFFVEKLLFPITPHYGEWFDNRVLSSLRPFQTEPYSDLAKNRSTEKVSAYIVYCDLSNILQQWVDGSLRSIWDGRPGGRQCNDSVAREDSLLRGSLPAIAC